jgi:hypothetical protein
MSGYQIIPYAGTAPGADSSTYTLFNSVPFRSAARSTLRFADYARYLVSLKNTSVGTLNASASADGGVTWQPFYSVAVPVSTAQRMNQIAVSLEGHVDVKVEWVNGGTAQTTWYVAQALDDGVAPLRAIFLDAQGDTDPGMAEVVTSPQLPTSLGQKVKTASLAVVQASDWTDPQKPATLGQKASAASLAVVQASDYVNPQMPATLGAKTGAASLSVVQASDYTNPQMPATLGQKTKAASLPVVLPSDQLGQQTSALSVPTVAASDSAERKAASLRGCIRGEELPIAVTTTSKTFTVPAAWLGKHVRMQADGADIYYQISLTATNAVADTTARATESGTPIALTASASGNGCHKIPANTFEDIPVPSNATTFALIGTAAACLRTHPAET